MYLMVYLKKRKRNRVKLQFKFLSFLHKLYLDIIVVTTLIRLLTLFILQVSVSNCPYGNS